MGKSPSGSPTLELKRKKCQIVQPHFSSLYTHPSVYAAYEDDLRSYFHGINDFNDIDYEYLDDFSAYYDAAHQAYDGSFPQTSGELNASHAVLISSLNTAGFLHYFAETRRWEGAVEDCRKHGIIPRY